MRAWTIPAFGIDNLQLTDRPEPSPGPGQVVVAVRAVSLNYRDLLIAKGLYNPRMPLPRVPCSDAAGEVVAIGPGVKRVAVGDRVCGTFMQRWVAGPVNDAVPLLRVRPSVRDRERSAAENPRIAVCVAH